MGYIGYGTMDGVGSMLAFLGGIFLIAFVLMLAVTILTVIGKWKVLDKMGRRPWAALIPFFSDYEMCLGAGAQQWLTIGYPVVSALCLVCGLVGPVYLYGLLTLASLVLCCMMCNAVTKAFSKGLGFTVGLFLLGVIFWPILGIGSAIYTPALYHGEKA